MFLCSAFNMIYHHILQSHLQLLYIIYIYIYIYIYIASISWFSLQLSDRSNSINIYDYISFPYSMKYGIPNMSS